MRIGCAGALLAIALISCGGGEKDPPLPLTILAPTAPMPLSPGNVDGQDEDPSVLVARGGNALYAAWYSNRAGLHPGGRERKEIFVARSTDGTTWTDPPVQVTDSPEWSFYPSLAQGADGAFHLTWMRWDLLPPGCFPVGQGEACPTGKTCCTGYTQRILHNRSADGIAWDPSAATTIADGPDDELAAIVAASDGRLLVYFDSAARNPLTKDLFVAVHDGAGWDPPLLLSTVSSASEHDMFPHVVERSPGEFLMTWTGWDPSVQTTPDMYTNGTTETMLSTSSDGLTWTAPVVASGPSPTRMDVFPFLYPDHARQSWSVLWVTQDGVLTVPVDDPVPANLGTLDIPGYTPRMLPSPTPGIYWAAWAEYVVTTAPTQKIRHRFLAR